MTRRRPWRAAMWVGVVACIGLAALWGASWRGRVGPVRWRGSDGWTWVCGCGRGVLVVGAAPPLHFSTLRWFAPLADGAAGGMVWGPVWWPRWSSGADGRGVWVPLWMPLLGAGAFTAWVRCRERRVPPGHCRVCRYDLSGLGPDSACPECGRPALNK